MIHIGTKGDPMQDGDSLQLDDQSYREEHGNVHGLTALERTLAHELRRFRPGGESARLRRELRRRRRAERRLQGRRRRQKRWLARRQRRELASLERRLLGRGPARFLSRFSRSGTDVETGSLELESRIAKAVEAALARQREQLWSEFQQALDLRIRLAVRRMEHQQEQSEQRVIERGQTSINKVTGEMWQSIDRRLGKEADRIEKEVERNVAVEMGRMYLRLSRPAEGSALPGRRP
jgi:hypothetical protein